MGIITLLAGCGVILVIAGIWFAVYYRLNPGTQTASGKARITGTCGDTMEISLSFQHDRVVASTHWTDGCVYSLNCVWIAAELAKGKTPQAILDIDADTIEKSVGGLSRDHFHCAGLAAETLHGAVDDYMFSFHTLSPED
jgi:NifU-like protein involved in Fe-S cluster formation